MDWSKAKTVLIVALLIMCLLLSGILLSRYSEEQKSARVAIEATIKYIDENHGILSTEIPSKRPSLPVFFVKSTAEKVGELKYKDYRICTDNGSENLSIVSVGKNKAKVMSASSAVLEVMTQPSFYSGYTEIKSIELVYYIDSQYGLSDGSEDTALPTWRIETNLGVSYINAYAQ